LRQPERSIQPNVQEALIQNISSLLIGNASRTHMGKEKTKETGRRDRNRLALIFFHWYLK
jgi:hypothetical protein